MTAMNNGSVMNQIQNLLPGVDLSKHMVVNSVVSVTGSRITATFTMDIPDDGSDTEDTADTAGETE